MNKKHYLILLGLFFVSLFALMCFKILKPVNQDLENVEALKPTNLYLPREYVDFPENSNENENQIVEKIEEVLGFDINVVLYNADSRQSINMTTNNEFSGLMVVKNALQLEYLEAVNKIQSFENYKNQIDKISMGIHKDGQYKGLQYGVVLGKRPDYAAGGIILGRKDVLEKAGISQLADTKTRFLYDLKRLSYEKSTPFAVFGSPLEGGFDYLKALFGVGSNFIETEYGLKYMKTSPQMKEYLEFVSSLYNDILIPQDFLFYDEYSLVTMLIEGKCAIAQFEHYDMAVHALKKAGEKSVELVVLPYPKPLSGGMPTFFDKNIAVMARGEKSPEKCLRLANYLQSNEYSEMVISLINDNSWAKQFLFEADFNKWQEKQDFITRDIHQTAVQNAYNRKNGFYTMPYQIRQMAKEAQLTEQYIYPFAVKAISSEISLSEFDKMVAIWQKNGGELVLEMINRYYANEKKQNNTKK